MLAKLAQNLHYDSQIWTFLGHFYKSGLHTMEMTAFKEKQHTSRNATMLFIAVVALTLVLTPTIGSMLLKPASAAPFPQGGQKLLLLTNTEQKSVNIDVRAAGQADGQDSILHISIDAQAATEKGKIIRFEQGATGSAELTLGGGAPPTTFDLSNIVLKASGAKITINAAFTDQDGDTGKITVSIYAKKAINADTGFINMTSKNNSVRLDYNAVNQHFRASGLNVQATADFT
jgi:FlaG/FlaF family flagellin (archaellin)